MVWYVKTLVPAVICKALTAAGSLYRTYRTTRQKLLGRNPTKHNIRLDGGSFLFNWGIRTLHPVFQRTNQKVSFKYVVSVFIYLLSTHTILSLRQMSELVSKLITNMIVG